MFVLKKGVVNNSLERNSIVGKKLEKKEILRNV